LFLHKALGRFFIVSIVFAALASAPPAARAGDNVWWSGEMKTWCILTYCETALVKGVSGEIYVQQFTLDLNPSQYGARWFIQLQKNSEWMEAGWFIGQGPDGRLWTGPTAYIAMMISGTYTFYVLEGLTVGTWLPVRLTIASPLVQVWLNGVYRGGFGDFSFSQAGAFGVLESFEAFNLVEGTWRDLQYSDNGDIWAPWDNAAAFEEYPYKVEFDISSFRVYYGRGGSGCGRCLQI